MNHLWNATVLAVYLTSHLPVIVPEQENSHFGHTLQGSDSNFKGETDCQYKRERESERNHENEEVIPNVIRNRSKVTMAELHLPTG